MKSQSVQKSVRSMRDLKFHEAANIFPLMEEHELDELGKDIAANGLQLPIELYEGKIIDGRNRYKACLIHCPDKIEAHDVDDIVSDPITYVLSMNLHRRHLSEGQRAMVAANVTTLKLGSNQHSKRGELFNSPSLNQAAEMVSVGRDSVVKAKRVIEHAEPEVVEAVQRDNLSLNTAAKASKLDKSIQKKVARVAKEQGNKAAVKEVERHLTREGLYSDSVGVKYAHKAIGQLKRIPPTDKLRARGFEIVAKWIAENK